jgi:hypothetical protein
MSPEGLRGSRATSTWKWRRRVDLRGGIVRRLARRGMSVARVYQSAYDRKLAGLKRSRSRLDSAMRRCHQTKWWMRDDRSLLRTPWVLHSTLLHPREASCTRSPRARVSSGSLCRTEQTEPLPPIPPPGAQIAGIAYWCRRKIRFSPGERPDRTRPGTPIELLWVARSLVVWSQPFLSVPGLHFLATRAAPALMCSVSLPRASLSTRRWEPSQWRRPPRLALALQRSGPISWPPWSRGTRPTVSSPRLARGRSTRPWPDATSWRTPAP